MSERINLEALLKEHRMAVLNDARKLASAMTRRAALKRNVCEKPEKQVPVAPIGAA